MLKKPKKKIKLSTLWKKAGISMQNYYRKQGLECYSCGQPATLVHHHIPQSRSRNLRFEKRNLVPLCGSSGTNCHLKHHCGDPSIAFRYRRKMMEVYGSSWEDNLITDSHKTDKRTAKDWREILTTLIHNYNL
jgi:hypothetical protein